MPLAVGETELERVLGSLPGLYSPIYLLTHPDLRQMPRVSAFFDFVVAEIEEMRSVFDGIAGTAIPARLCHRLRSLDFR
jgi:hypothetical protein